MLVQSFEPGESVAGWIEPAVGIETVERVAAKKRLAEIGVRAFFKMVRRMSATKRHTC